MHASDFHFDRNASACSSEHLQIVIDKIVSLSADLVLLTGDFIILDPSPIHQLAKRLSVLKPKHGVFASLGNHEHYHPDGREFVTNELQKNHISVLRNGWTELVKNVPLYLAGLEDMWSPEWKGHGSVMKKLETLDGVKIIMSHNPDSTVILKEYDFDLILSGHTHGGQICLPGFPFFSFTYPYVQCGPAVLGIVRWFVDAVPFLKRVMLMVPFLRGWKKVHKYIWVVDNWKWAHGLFEIAHGNPFSQSLKRRYLSVSRGIGAHYSLRLFCQPEITHFTLVSAE